MTLPDRHRTPIFRFPVTSAPENLEALLGALPATPEKVEAAVRRVGSLRLRRAALWTAVGDLQSRPRIAGYPPRIFISYRWEDEAVKAWCQRLADHLRRRGYEVLLRQTLAHALLALGRVAQAADAARSVERLPGRPTVETTIDLALVLEEAGQPRDALRVTTKVIALPTSLQPRIRRMASSLLDDLGAPEAALRQLRYALRLPEAGRDPKLGSDLDNLVGFVLLFGLGEPEAALPHFVSGSALDPENQHLGTNHLVCLITLGHTGQARQIIGAWQGRAALIEPLRRLIEAIDGGVDVRAPTSPRRRPPPTHVCSACDAGYRLGPQTALCAVCGATSAVYGLHGGWSCCRRCCR